MKPNTERLTDENFLLFCAKHYDNNPLDTEEFYEDIDRIKYIKKLITRYVENDDIKERLILNHIIILNNCFGANVTCKILYLKLRKQMKYIKPFLTLLNILPDKLYNVADQDIIDMTVIENDEKIAEKLRII